VYTELHLHTAYSLLDGASQPEEMALMAKQLGYTALAITDHDSLSGAFEFATALKHHDIQPITGAELTLADGSHVTLLAETREGYGNLCRLITESKHGKPPAAVAVDDAARTWFTTSLAEYAEGLILLTGCRESQLARLVTSGKLAEAEAVLRTYLDWFGRENVFVEVQHHRVAGDRKRVRGLVRLARRLGVHYVATGNVHYHRPDRARLQDVLVAIKHRTTLDGSHRLRRPNGEFFLRAPAAWEAFWHRYPDAVRSTEIIAERCAAFDLTEDLGYAFPDFEDRTGASADDQLARVCGDVFAERYPAGSEHVARARLQLAEELRLIRKHRLAGYFLIYRDLLTMAREVATELRGAQPSASRTFLPPGRGRGSAVSSIVCYLIGLSPVDPLAHDLYVGRFLNERMNSVPDIDIDFPREIREKMIARVYETYGREYAAMVCAFATYRLKSAVRDVGKALGLPADDLERIAKLSESRGADGIADELRRLPEYAERMQIPPWSYLVELATQLAGFPRHITQHSGGMVISSTPLTRIVPVQPAAMDGRYICQWDKDSTNDAGLIKIDFLALGMLSLVEECLDHIDARGGKPIDLSRINYNDAAVYQMIQEGDTIGVFQVESRAQIQMIRRTKPKSLDDLVVQVAIVRPGPIIGGAVTPFVQRRLDPAYLPTYDHPLLEPVLKETLGVVLYQEQVVQVAEVIAGFSAGEADQLRRAMTRKRSLEAMQEMRARFMAGASRRDVPESLAAELFTKLEGFASYGFPKSHAAAFGLLAYQSCWLKHYYPAEFLASLLNNQPMGFYAPHILINDARRHGLRVLRPDINDSGVECTVEGPRSIRIGLRLIKGVSEELAVQILAERSTNGPYRSLIDILRRVAMRPEAQEALIASGACDGFGLQRREMLWQRGLIIAPRGFRDKGTRKHAGQQLALPLPVSQDYIERPPTTAWQRMEDSYRVLGFSLLNHPIGLLRHQLPQTVTSSRELEALPDGMPVMIPGLVAVRQRPGTAKGVTFLMLEDEHGLFNVIVYPGLYEKQRYEVRSVPFLIVEGRVQRDTANITIIATRLHAIEEHAGADDGRVPWSAGEDRSIDVDWRTVSYARDAERARRISRASLHAVKPHAHSYR